MKKEDVRNREIKVQNNLLIRREKELDVLLKKVFVAEKNLIKLNAMCESKKTFFYNTLCIKFFDKHIKLLRSKLREIEVLDLKTKEGLI